MPAALDVLVARAVPCAGKRDGAASFLGDNFFTDGVDRRVDAEDIRILIVDRDCRGSLGRVVEESADG